MFNKLLDIGVDPNDNENGGCSIIQGIISRLEWKIRRPTYDWEFGRKDEGHDSEATREYMKMVYVLASRGAK